MTTPNTNKTILDITNNKMLTEASDDLLFLNDTYEDKKKSMGDMEFLIYVENVAQDIVYNLTQTIRNLTKEIDDE